MHKIDMHTVRKVMVMYFVFSIIESLENMEDSEAKIILQVYLFYFSDLNVF